MGYNPLVTWLLRSPLHWLLSGGTLLLTYTGRRSGQRYTLPISYGREDGVLRLITHRRKTWWKNIGGGAPVSVRVRGRDLTGIALATRAGPEAPLPAMLKVYRGMPRRLAEQRAPDMVLVTVRLQDSPPPRL